MIPLIIFGFILGVALGSFVVITKGFFLALVFLTFVLFFYRFFIEEKHRAVIFLAFIFMLGVLMGVGRMSFSDLNKESLLNDFAGRKINVEGIIVDEPDTRENNVKLTVKLSDVFVGTTTVTVREKILVTTSLYPEFKYGDRVSMDVLLEQPKEIEGEDGRVFDYVGYLRVRGIWYTSRFTEVKLISSGQGNSIKSLLFKTKNAFVESINNALPEPESSLLSGLLLGSKQSLGKDLLLEFQRTGTSHVVVLSGYNIAIVAESIMAMLTFLPKTLAFGFGVLGIILFTTLSGGSASAVRAAIMVLVALSARKLNRDYKASRALGFAIVLMLAPNPLLLAFDPSFQLSVLATVGLIFVSPLVSPHLSKVTEKFGLREIVASTIATQVTVLPFLIYNMGVLSLVSLPVNVLILSTVPLTMFLGFFTGIVGFISLYLSYIPAFFTYIFLWYQLKIVHLGSSVSFGAISLPAFSPIILILLYAAIFAGLYYLKKKFT